jgi:hypothetical protein
LNIYGWTRSSLKPVDSAEALPTDCPNQVFISESYRYGSNFIFIFFLQKFFKKDILWFDPFKFFKKQKGGHFCNIIKLWDLLWARKINLINSHPTFYYFRSYPSPSFKPTCSIKKLWVESPFLFSSTIVYCV